MHVVRTLPLRLGPYLLTERIGAGGMAAIYRGRRRVTAGGETHVVVKILLPEHRRNQRYVRLFKDEARLSAQLRHANVVHVHDFGSIAGIPFLEMEDLSGWNLAQLWDAVAARGERLPVAIALALISEACRGLAYAHAFVDERGAHTPIIHRDVSPANIMISREGSVKLIDFGSARQTRGETLEIDTFLGTLAYMSPEQLERRTLDRRADVFALGVTLWELVTGRRLFAADNIKETLQRLQMLVFEPPSKINPEAPATLDAIVLRALHRDPDQRFGSAGEMLEALDTLAGLGATRARLLAYLGRIAPRVFTHACGSCGAAIAWGADCATCKTCVEAPVFDDELRELALPAPAPAPTPPPPPRRWLERRWLLLQLELRLRWSELAAWSADRRLRALLRR